MAMLARYNLVIADESGNIVNGATVEVRRESDNGLGALFSDRAGASPKTNSFVAADGSDAGFHVVGGAYKITATLGAFNKTFRYIAIGTAAEADATSFGAASDVVTALTAVIPSQLFQHANLGGL